MIFSGQAFVTENVLTTLKVDRTRKGQEMKLLEMKGSWKLKLSRN
jgi:hypothetical protein